MNYILSVEPIGKKGKFLYIVKDETGNEISRRESFRKYVACTIYGANYFGRLDLIGKGDHGKYLQRCAAANAMPIDIAFITPAQVVAWDLVEVFETFAEKQFNQQHPEANP